MKIRNILFGLILLGVSSSVIAVPITGSINFSGGVTTNTGNILTATVFTFNNPITVTSATLALAPLATFGSVLYNNPLNINSLPALLWQQFVAGTGYIYSFNLASITTNTTAFGIFRLISGSGSLNIAGLGSPYTTTAATWTLSSQVGGSTTFSFSASSTPVPEPMPLALVALGLIGIGFFSQKRELKSAAIT